MAQIEGIVEHLIRWETGTFRKQDESLKSLYLRARAKGVSSLEGDTGGDTCVGVTLATYKQFNGGKGDKKALGNMSYQTWLGILKDGFWDRWQADRIDNQSVANMLVDWLWHSGIYGIKLPQRVIGVTADGIVGDKTIGAIALWNSETLFNALKAERLAYVNRLAAARYENMRFLAGWENRINSIAYVP